MNNYSLHPMLTTGQDNALRLLSMNHSVELQQAIRAISSAGLSSLAAAKPLAALLSHYTGAAAITNTLTPFDKASWTFSLGTNLSALTSASALGENLAQSMMNYSPVVPVFASSFQGVVSPVSFGINGLSTTTKMFDTVTSTLRESRKSVAQMMEAMTRPSIEKP